MKKTYITPECEKFCLPTGILMLPPSKQNISISNEEADEGGFSKQWGGSIFEDEEDTE